MRGHAGSEKDIGANHGIGGGGLDTRFPVVTVRTNLQVRVWSEMCTSTVERLAWPRRGLPYSTWAECNHSEIRAARSAVMSNQVAGRGTVKWRLYVTGAYR